ncbi:WD-40 repeat-containing protein MSI4 [Trifolium repens]|nr:WD-40 repeat-containing protein MSI4 [Trifolium repens]
MNSKKEGGSASHQISVEDRYSQWKSHIPVLYDWFVNHNLVWPTQSCRWGSLLEQQTYKNRHRLYISEQTDGTPNTLVIATVEVEKPRVAAAEHIAQFNEEARSPFVKKHKTILHPGEVNRIRELPTNTNIVATHTDSPNVMIWSVESQPNRTVVMGAPTSTPDLVLTGHKDNAEFALAMCSTEPFVLSGGRDQYVVLWCIQDHIATLAAEVDPDDKQSTNVGGSSEKAAKSPSVGPRGIYRGHNDTVEDVQFCPSSAQEFCSVGDDSCLILWDARVEKAHDGDLHCVDWNTHDINFILTGSADNTVRMFDRRKLNSQGVGSLVYKFEGHNAPVLCVQWCPDKSSVFGSGAENGIINIWDNDKVGKMPGSADPTVPATSPGLFFRHAGHRDKIVDFHWNAFDPWTIVSVSDDCASTGGGGTLQIWRMLDLIYRPEDEVLAELDKCLFFVTLLDVISAPRPASPPVRNISLPSQRLVLQIRLELKLKVNLGRSKFSIASITIGKGRKVEQTFDFQFVGNFCGTLYYVERLCELNPYNYAESIFIKATLDESKAKCVEVILHCLTLIYPSAVTSLMIRYFVSDLGFKDLETCSTSSSSGVGVFGDLPPQALK